MSWFSKLFTPAETPIPSHAPSPDQDRELVLYKFDACPYCQRVQRQVNDLKLTGIQFRDTRRDPANRRELQAKTGRTQVPCLFIDGEPLFESRDIAAWLGAYAAR